MKFKMAEKSLFATLLRSPWWVSLAIAAVLGLLAMSLLPGDYRVVGATSGFPFLVIAVIAAARQWRLPSAARVLQTQQAVTAMAWPEFAALLEAAFRRDGYQVAPGGSAAIDFELEAPGPQDAGQRAALEVGAHRPGGAAPAAGRPRGRGRGRCALHRPGPAHRHRTALCRHAPDRHLAGRRGGAGAARPAARPGEGMKRRLLLSAAVGSVAGMAQAQPAALLTAAEAGDLMQVQRLLDAGTPVDARDERREVLN